MARQLAFQPCADCCEPPPCESQCWLGGGGKPSTVTAVIPSGFSADCSGAPCGDMSDTFVLDLVTSESVPIWRYFSARNALGNSWWQNNMFGPCVKYDSQFYVEASIDCTPNDATKCQVRISVQIRTIPNSSGAGVWPPALTDPIPGSEVISWTWVKSDFEPDLDYWAVPFATRLTTGYAYCAAGCSGAFPPSTYICDGTGLPDAELSL